MAWNLEMRSRRRLRGAVRVTIQRWMLSIYGADDGAASMPPEYDHKSFQVNHKEMVVFCVQ